LTSNNTHRATNNPRVVLSLSLPVSVSIFLGHLALLPSISSKEKHSLEQKVLETPGE
jgi:hypothetical protein